MRDRFFSSFDWAAFWMATLATFAVYFYTLGPSVGLEDSGELATAAAHLGVPHAPGYPFWTFCSWIFCKLFSGVTYMGHPTPAWAVSLCSAVFGAFAAGCTAMLICRSAQDFLAARARRDPEGGWERHVPWLCFAGGVGGALTFAFSPVEWSQSTMVEIYSLGSLFLMLVLLLSYRWMRRPSDRILWATAFVFGLGLTNYQVLLFAIVPLALVIALRNIALFRDFAIFLIPVLLTYQVLQVGDLSRAQHGMTRDVIAKQAPVGVDDDEFAVFSLQPWYGMRLSDPSRFDNAREYIRRVQLPDLERQRAEASRRLDEGLRKAGAARDALAGAERRAKDGKASGEAVEAARSKASAEADAVRGLRHALEEAERAVASDRRLCNEVLPAVDRRARTLGPKARALLLSDDPKPPVARTSRNPSGVGVFLSLALFVGALVASLVLRRRRPDLSAYAAAGGGLACAAGLLLSATLFSSEAAWDLASTRSLTAPLADPLVYIAVGVFSAASVAFAVAWLRIPGDRLVAGRPARTVALAASVASALAAVAVAYLFVPSSDGLSTLFGYCGEEYPWGKSTLVFAALVVALFALTSFVKGGLAFAIPVAGFHLAVFILLRNGAMNGLVHPGSWWFWWPLAWNFTVLALAWHVLPNGRSVAGAALFAQLGVAFYAYMPIVSDLRNPPMNWAYPRTWEGFKHAITRGQYEAIQAESFDSFREFVQNFMQKLEYYFDDVKLQFTDFLVLLAAVPFACWRVAVRTRGGAFSFRALWAVGGILCVLLLRDVFGSGDAGEGSAWLFFDRVLVAALAAFALAGVAVVVARQFVLRPAVAVRRFLEASLAAGRRGQVAAFAVLAAEVAVAIVLALGRAGGAAGVAMGALACAACAALVASVRPVLRLVRRARAAGCGATFEGGDVTQQWLITSGACFLVMSALLIILAKVQGDIQDNFIQKVKFIMSHAMIALWIGYGLAFTAALVARLVPARSRRWAVAALVPFAVAAAAWQPLAQNYANDRLVFELGGAEQDGHTFGWQFGAYQLDGAKAVRAQIEADEEPLPDPDWPPEMEDHAVFFGGTDPGRFVPTYMIYSAEYRPDVYLITQNALADQTYMAVERDLYGDEIWIPANEDNGRAFEDFVKSLSEDERAAYGVSTENGRVQVTGALSVMKINERLTRVMFEKNSPRHAFYVEESYPIDWMYDYLTPHGLIMKIGPEKTSGDAADGRWRDLLRRDRDFWDWYTRRLLDDPMYRRDFAAQKSFAKLRSAISGLAFNRRFRARSIASSEAFRDASEQGFREACLLGPISPESTLRYIQTHLVNRGASDAESEASLNVVEELLDYIDEKDPRNVRTKNHRKMVSGWRELISFRRDLADMESRLAERLRAADAPGAEERDLAWRVVAAYAGLAELNSAEGAAQAAAQCTRRAVGYLRGILPETTEPERIALAAELLVAAHQDDAAEKAVTQYGRATDDPRLQKLPASLWIVLAKVYSRRGAPSRKYLKGSVDWLRSRHASAWADAVAGDPEVGAIDRALGADAEGQSGGGARH